MTAPTPIGTPISGLGVTEGSHNLHSGDANEGFRAPDVLLASGDNSALITLSNPLPIVAVGGTPPAPVLHRSGTAGSGALSAQDTSSPTTLTSHDTNTAGSVPSGAVGGPGSSWVDFYITVVGGTAASTVTVMPRLWNERQSLFFDTAATDIALVAGQTVNTTVRVATLSQFCFLAVTALPNSSTLTADARTM